MSDEHKKRISQANKGKKAPNRKYWLGKKRSKETKDKMSRLKKEYFVRLKKEGKKHHNWKGGYENTKLLQRARRTRKRNAKGSHTLAEWLNLKAQYNWTCLCCHKKEPFLGQKYINLTEDHIIPLIKGGSNNIENIQPLCQSCNSKKHSEIINYK